MVPLHSSSDSEALQTGEDPPKPSIWPHPSHHDRLLSCFFHTTIRRHSPASAHCPLPGTQGTVLRCTVHTLHNRLTRRPHACLTSNPIQLHSNYQLFPQPQTQTSQRPPTSDLSCVSPLSHRAGLIHSARRRLHFTLGRLLLQSCLSAHYCNQLLHPRTARHTSHTPTIPAFVSPHANRLPAIARTLNSHPLSPLHAYHDWSLTLSLIPAPLICRRIPRTNLLLAALYT